MFSGCTASDILHVKDTATGRYKLEAIAFIAGAAVIVIEICGARMLAPYLGDTLFTWTSSISVVLASLGVGYMLGGRIADRWHDARILSLVLVASGAATLAIILISSAVLSVSLDFGFEYGPLFASVMLFAIPNIMLGMVTPYAVRLRSKALGKVGKNVGNIYAIATMGSIAGALLSGYFLIPYIGITQSFFAMGVILVTGGIALVFGSKGLFILAAVAAYPFVPQFHVSISGGQTIYQTDTAYYHLEVVNYSGSLGLVTDLSLQTLVPKNRSEITQYYGYQGIIYKQAPVSNALYLGLGGGAMVDQLYNDTNASIDVVEIDSSVVAVAKRFFGLPNSSRITIYEEDARFFLRVSAKKYNMIVLDTYGGSLSMPYQMLTIQAAQEMSSHLSSNGSVLINLVSPVDGNYSGAFKSVYKTFNAVFPNLYIFPLNPLSPQSEQNIIIIASTDKTRWSVANISRAFNATVGNSTSYEVAAEQYYHGATVNTIGYPILTDNRNSYDVYAAQALQNALQK